MKGQLSSLLLPLFQEIHNPKNSHKEKKDGSEEHHCKMSKVIFKNKIQNNESHGDINNA